MCVLQINLIVFEKINKRNWKVENKISEFSIRDENAPWLRNKNKFNDFIKPNDIDLITNWNQI